MKRLAVPLSLLGLLALLMVPVTAASADTAPVQVGQLFTNDGTTFRAGTSEGFKGGYVNTCDKGDVFTITATSYEDIGKVYWIGTLNDLRKQGLAIHGTGVSANIWIDTDNNGQFFMWNGDVLSGLGKDDYGALNGMTINGHTGVSELGGNSSTWNNVHTLNDLAVPGDTLVAIWVGIAGSQPATGAVTQVGGHVLTSTCTTPTPAPTVRPSSSPSPGVPGLPNTGQAP